MKKFCFLMLLLFVSSAVCPSFGQATNPLQQKKPNYEITVSSPHILADSAQVKSSITTQDESVTEVLQLSFLAPFKVESFLPNSSLKVTAFNDKGDVFGMRIWNSVPGNYLTRFNQYFAVNLDLRSDFKEAAKFKLDLLSADEIDDAKKLEQLGASLSSCGALAVRSCGTGKVKSFSCSTNKEASGCEFTCKASR